MIVMRATDVRDQIRVIPGIEQEDRYLFSTSRSTIEVLSDTIYVTVEGVGIKEIIVSFEDIRFAETKFEASRVPALFRQPSNTKTNHTIPHNPDLSVGDHGWCHVDIEIGERGFIRSNMTMPVSPQNSFNI